MNAHSHPFIFEFIVTFFQQKNKYFFYLLFWLDHVKLTSMTLNGTERPQVSSLM